MLSGPNCAAVRSGRDVQAAPLSGIQTVEQHAEYRSGSPPGKGAVSRAVDEGLTRKRSFPHLPLRPGRRFRSVPHTDRLRGVHGEHRM